MEKTIRIGVTFTGTDEKHSNYVNWLNSDDPIEVITLSPEDDNLEMAKDLDGIILSGGIDMHPKYYQCEIIDYPNAPVKYHEARDEFEMAVFTISLQHEIPVLAVCRGMQLVNCIAGGNLTQDLGEQGNAVHRFVYNDKAHGINIAQNTLLSEITPGERTVANSAHHQCINDLGNGLKVNCTSDDGIIEGIEWEVTINKPFFLGVQWHPERMYKFQLQEAPLSKNIRDRFIREVKKSKNRL